MPDNVVIVQGANATPSGGTVVATDEVVIGGQLVQCQRIKLVLGADGAYDLDLDSGQQTMANSLPVVIASNQTPPGAATTPTIYNVSMVLANTEYSQALPANTKGFSLQCLTDYDIRFAFETGHVAGPVAPYALVRAGMNYYMSGLNLAAVTVFVACGNAAQVAEIIAWA